MATQWYQGTKPNVNVCTIGSIDHGKTTLTGAITRALGGQSPTDYRAFESAAEAPKERGLLRGWRSRRAPDQAPSAVDKAAAEQGGGITNVQYETERRHYTHADCPGRGDYINSMLTGSRMDGAILVVSAADGPTPQTRDHLLLARRVEVPAIVVFLNKVDVVDDEELQGLVEMELRELVSQCGFPGNTMPVIRGSALKALKGDQQGAQSILQLTTALDSYIPASSTPSSTPYGNPASDPWKSPQ